MVRVRIHKKPMKKTMSVEELRHAKPLCYVSAVLLVLSIFMPGFFISGNTDPEWYGLMILMVSPLAWMNGISGLAVYANFVYVWVWLRLLSGVRVKESVFLMVGLALCTFTLREVMIDENGGTRNVVAWGWGAIVWGAAMILLAGASWDKRRYRSVFHTLLPYITIFTLITVSLLLLHEHQWRSANSDERKHYLPQATAFVEITPIGVPIMPLGAAFGVFTPSGVPYLPPPEKLPLPSGTIVELAADVQFDRSDSEPEIHIAGVERTGYTPNRFIYRGYLFHERYELLSIAPSRGRRGNFVYGIRPSRQGEPGEIIQYIADRKQNRNIWYAPAIVRKRWLYPNFTSEIPGLLNELRPEKPFTLPKPLEFDGKARCVRQAYSLPFGLNPEQVTQFDNIVLTNTNLSIRPQFNDIAAFCSGDYALAVKAAHGEDREIFYAVLLRRGSGEILASYYGWVEGEEWKDLPEQWFSPSESGHIEQISLSDGGMIIRSDRGVFRFSRDNEESAGWRTLKWEGKM